MYNCRTRTDSGSGPRLTRTGSSTGMRGYTTDSSRFGSSAALRQAVENTRGNQGD